MNFQARHDFMHDLLHACYLDLYRRIAELPDEWDGHEMRVWIAEHFHAQAAISEIVKHPDSQRARDYRNTIMVRNL